MIRFGKSLTVLAAVLLGYAAILLALIHPELQRNLLYLHRIKYPFRAQFDRPEKYGLAPYKTRNFRIRTSDGELLGAWHVLPRSVYANASDSFPPTSPLSDEVFDGALKDRPTIIYFHGNAATRALSHRVRSLSDYSNRLDCNAIAIDYRGFGDSTGSPSEDGLLQDAQAAWDWTMRRNGNDPATIALVGHSLGTAVTSKLVGKLADDEVHPRAVALIAPFTSIPELLLTYRIAGIPLISPLRSIPYFQQWLLRWLRDSWWSSRAIVKTKSPILIVHALDDLDIPSTHSEALFEEMCDGCAREVVHRPGWGKVTSGVRAHGSELIWYEGEHGEHNQVAVGEGVTDLIGRIVYGSEKMQLSC